MPRSRRRHHSRSRSRSRSHSHERDREPKRRKIDNVDSPAHKRSVSSESTSSSPKRQHDEEIKDILMAEDVEHTASETATNTLDTVETIITPTKSLMSPRQAQKKIDSEKKRQQKQLEREEREKKKQEEKERLRLEKLKQKQEKDEQKAKERELKEEQKRKEREEKEEQKRKEREEKDEQKRKGREEKEAKRKEKEEREEQKRKEREQEKLKKQQELDEKNKEKQKQEEQKQKTAAAFVNFFVSKKPSDSKIEGNTFVKSIFMPFQVKSDMRLPPQRRPVLTADEQESLSKAILSSNPDCSYLKDLKKGKTLGKCPKTWPFEDEVVVVEDFGESICEDKPKLKRMRAKFLKFHENRRPPYFGTWSKKTNFINPRKPFGEDKNIFDYEVDSDDDWEEEDQGESLNGSDDEEKENEIDNEDYEVDNEFFVPHGHLSDDEIDEEPTTKLSPESQKQKLKLLKDEFDQDMQMKTHKIKPRSIGCIWYNKDGSNIDEAINRHLKPFAMITNGRILIAKRNNESETVLGKKSFKSKLKDEILLDFLKLIHRNIKKSNGIVKDFLEIAQNNGIDINVSKGYLGRCVKKYAVWGVCSEEGPVLNKNCWLVKDDVKKLFNIE